MAKSGQVVPQDYPRIQDEQNPYYGCLEETALLPHTHKIPSQELKGLILAAIKNANKKSSREMLSIPANSLQDEIDQIYIEEGKNLFKYFKKYVGDPAASAYQIHGKHFRDVGKEQFRNRMLQKERMNSGWRYQFLVLDCAQKSRRFKSISDIGAAEADFNAVIEFQDQERKPLTLYVSVKNRSNTMGGQDWPKAIHALENVARTDKNRTGPYCCVFGIAMDRGTRYIKREQKTEKPHSVNTEVWLSDFFWPFFSNYSYEEMMTAVLEVLIETDTSENKLSTQIEIPERLLKSFGHCCQQAGLIDEAGNFHDPYKLVTFFCQK
jgi:hypothetical protein